MPEDVYAQALRFTVTESANSTLTEGNAILTGASVRGQGGIAIEVHRIIGQLGLPEDNPAATAQETAYGSISTRSGLTSIPALGDEHCVYTTSKLIRGGVATYLPLVFDAEDLMPRNMRYVPPILLSHSRLYPYVLSTNSSATHTFQGQIWFNYVDITGELAIEALEVFR